MTVRSLSVVPAREGTDNDPIGTMTDGTSEAGAPSRVSPIDRLIATVEVSSYFHMPCAFTFLVLLFSIVPAPLAILDVHRFALAVLDLSMMGSALLLFLIEASRAAWRLAHPYASRRWLRAVRAAVGDAFMREVLVELRHQHRGDHDYVITREELAKQSRIVRYRHREADRRTQGARLNAERTSA